MNEPATPVTITIERTLFPSGRSIDLPADPFWPLRVRVGHDRDPVPFKEMLAFHWQHGTPLKGGVLPA